MSSKSMQRLIVWFGIGFFILSVGTHASAEGSFSIQWGKKSDSENEQAKIGNKKGGPPDHAPAHGYRSKYRYRYYPANSVYFDSARQIYFYLKGENWEVGASLPAGLKTDFGDYVSIELDTDKSYVYYSKHKKQYPPGKTKNKKAPKSSQKSKK